MISALATTCRSIFSKGALRMLNACAKFCYNFAPGFGIKFAKISGSVVVALDVQSQQLQNWIKLAAGVQSAATNANENLEPSTSPEDGGDSQASLPEGLSLDNTEWTRGQSVKRVKNSSGKWVDYTDENGKTVLAGIRMQVVSRVVRAFDTDYFFWRWAYYDTAGCLYKLSAEQGVFAEVNYDEYLNI